jgi:5-methylcytosine-specific restriction endonuclease McrA
MNVEAATKRTGYEIVRLYTPYPDDIKQVGWRALDAQGKVVAEKQDTNLATALQDLCDLIYDVHRQIVLERSKGRCEQCGGRRHLQIHHKIFRSHGRDDRISNLIVLDLDCHERAHKHKHQTRF